MASIALALLAGRGGDFVAVAADATQPKAALAPVPNTAAQYKAEHTVKRIFADEYSHDGNAARLALANKLVGQGQQTEGDPAMRFVLLREARDLAAGAGDTAVAFAAIDEMAKSFAVDAIDLKTAAFTTASLHASRDEMRGVVDTGLELLDQAAANDHFAATTRLAPILETAAGKTKEIPLLTRVQTRNREVADQRREFDRQKATFVALYKNPADPDANLAVGRYLCFMKGNWDTGLPMLAKGADAALKDLATKDLAQPADAKAQLQIGDAWWTLAAAQIGAAKSHIERHASGFYQSSYAGVTPADQTRIASRMPKESTPRPAVVVVKPATTPTTVATAVGKPATPLTPVTPPPSTVAAIASRNTGKTVEPPSHKDAEGHRVVDLMALIDGDSGNERGIWKRTGSELISRGDFALLSIAYQPPAEYDFVIEFTATEFPPRGPIGQYLTHGACQFRWMMENDDSGASFGVEYVKRKGARDADNPTHVTRPAALQKGKRYSSTIRVRNDSIAALFDGQLITQYATDFADVGNPNSRVYNGLLGLSSGPAILFHKIELVEITGKGQVIPPPPDDPQLVRTYVGGATERDQVQRQVFLTSDGRRVVQQGYSTTIWDREGEKVLLNWDGNAPRPSPNSPDGRYMVGLHEGRPMIVQLSNPARTMDLPETGGLFSVAFSRDSTRLAINNRKEILLWDLTGKKMLQQSQAMHGSRLEFSSDGQRLLTWTNDGVSMMDAHTLKEVWVVGKPYFNGESHPSFSPDGTRVVAVGPGGGTLHVLNSADGKVIASCRVQSGAIEPKFSPNGRLVLAWMWDTGGPVVVCDAATGDELDQFSKLDLPVISADWSPDSKRILVGCKNAIMVLLDAETGATLQTFTGHVGPVWAVCFSADGKFVASSCNDSKVRVFRVAVK